MKKRITRVLLVDDSRSFRTRIRSFLERDKNIQVVGEAADGVEAVDLIRRLQPDLVLLDMEMPHLDGLGVIHRLAEEKLKPCILVFSGHVDEQFVEGVLEQDVNGYLAKDIEPKRMVEAICNAAAGRKLGFLSGLNGRTTAA